MLLYIFPLVYRLVELSQVGGVLLCVVAIIIIDVCKDELKKLKDARVFEGIKKLPARVKCATLSWHTMENILEK